MGDKKQQQYLNLKVALENAELEYNRASNLAEECQQEKEHARFKRDNIRFQCNELAHKIAGEA